MKVTQRPFAPGADWRGILLAGGLIAVSGNPVVSSKTVLPVFMLLLIVVALALRGKRLSRGVLHRYAFTSLIFFVIFVSQQIIFGTVSIQGSAFFLFKMLTAAIVAGCLGPSFGRSIFMASYYLCAVSLVCFTSLLVVGPVSFPTLFSEELIGPNLKSIGVFTVVNTPDWWRNAGALWEPGAFQGLIALSVLLYLQVADRRLGDRWRVTIMLVALLTTFSTTGYLALFLLSAIYVLSTSRSFAQKAGLLVFAAAAALFAGTNLEFIAPKIYEQIAQSGELSEFSPARFAALQFDLQYIEKHPFVGNGLAEVTRYADHPYLHGRQLGHGNGLSNFAATFGLLGLATYFYAVFNGWPAAKARDKFAATSLLILLAFSQQFLFYPLFLALMYIDKSRARAVRSEPFMHLQAR